MQPGTKKLFSLLWAFLLAWLGLRFLLPLFAPFLLGAALALAAEPMVCFLSRRVHIPRPVSAGISVSMVFCLMAMLLLLLCGFLIRELRTLGNILPDLTLTIQNGVSLLQSWLLELASRAPGSIRSLLQENMHALFSSGSALLDQAVRYVLTFTGNLLSHIPDSALTLFTAVFSGFLISAKLPRIKAWLRSRIPRERIQALLASAQRIRHAAFGWLLAQIKLMSVTFAILSLSFLLLRIPHALLWASVTALVDALPVLGTGTILIPWSILSFLQGNTARAIGLAGSYITVSLIRSGLEPKLLGRHLGLDPLVTLVTLYAGIKLWGIGGMLLAPLLTVTAFQILPERKKRDTL